MSNSCAPVMLNIDDLLAPAGTDCAAADTTVEAGQFCLHYQPVLDVDDGRLIAVKALLRWEHPVLGILSPRRFMPQILRAGRTFDLCRTVLQRASLDLHAWHAIGVESIRVDIELLQKQFNDPGLPTLIDAILARHRLSPTSICLQISEAVLRQNPEANRRLLEQLKRRDVRLALTNFGAGAFAVDELATFPFERINVGAAFVQDMVTIADDAAMAQRIIESAHALDMRVGADGIETAIEFSLLRDLACDEVQGPYLMRAVPAVEIGRMLAQGGTGLTEGTLPRKPRSLLLVDDEPNILSALKRLLRPGGYDIATANSGMEALALLEQREFDVIICDQRMPGMSGVEFFGVAKTRYPDTVRLILSGYTELQSVIDAVNQGAIYKFLCKPWDDLQLSGHVSEAFQRKELADENKRLNMEVYSANQRLALANRQLEAVLKQKQLQIQSDEVSLQIVWEALHFVPLPVFGLDDDNLVVFGNLAAQAILQKDGALLGYQAESLLPELARAGDDSFQVDIKQKRYTVKIHNMGNGSRSRGKLLVMMEIEHDHPK